MFVNIDQIRYIDTSGNVSIRRSHVIAKTIQSYMISTGPIFYIEFFNNDGLILADINKVISSEYLDKVRRGDFKIAFHNIHEGFHNITTGILAFAIKHEIPTENIIVMTANHNLAQWAKEAAKKFNTSIPRVVLCDIFEIQASNVIEHFSSIDVKTYNPREITHRYLNLNRRQRSHRPMLVAALINSGLHHSGKISFGPSDFNEGPRQRDIMLAASDLWEICPEMSSNIRKNMDEIMSHLPMYLDHDDLVQNYAHSNIADCELYRTTMCSVVSETTFFSHACARSFVRPEPGVFLSEKTWKAISHRHPWIMVSQPGTQEILRSKGYKTFGEFFDESYDYEQDDYLRMLMIYRVIEKICNWTPQKVKEFLAYSGPITQYNQNLLRSKINTRDFFKELT